MIHLYEGDGKGKTTAAIGLAVRAAGAGKKVLFTQFMKGGESAELSSLALLPNIELLRCKEEFPFYFQMTKEDKEKITAYHDEILIQVRERVDRGECDVVIMDEITYPYNWNLIDQGKIEGIITEYRDKIEIVFTGRDPALFLTEHADYITMMTCIRHPFEKGVQARKGIEY